MQVTGSLRPHLQEMVMRLNRILSFIPPFFYFYFFYTERWYLEIGGTYVSSKFHVKIKCSLTKKVKPSSL